MDANIVTDIKEKCNMFYENSSKKRQKIEYLALKCVFLEKNQEKLCFSPQNSYILRFGKFLAKHIIYQI